VAAVTNAYVPTADSSNVTSYASPAFTPTVGDLLIGIVPATGTVLASPTLTASANGITFTLVGSATKNTSADTLYVFVANQLAPAAPASMTLTFDCTGDAATGAIVCCALVSGMTQTGLAAIRQNAKIDNVLGGTAPTTTFAASALTGNPTIQAVLTTVATGSTPPTNWTERVDTTYSLPTTGGGYSSRDSGFTGTAITLGSTANGACCAFAVELDTSAPLPLLVMAPRNY
jgi:hypothetical protein